MMKNWRRKLFTLLFMVVLMLGLAVTAYALGEDKIKVTLDDNGGSGGSGSVIFNRKRTYSVSSDFMWWTDGYVQLKTPTKTGYTFDGYYNAKTGGNEFTRWDADKNAYTTKYPYESSGLSYKNDYMYLNTSESNNTLYAHWTANPYTVSFDQNGGTGGQTGTKTATYDSAMPGPVTKPTRTGYTFAGYYDAKSGGTQYYKADGTSAKAWDKAANTTLYAQWTANQYTVTFDRQNGTGGSASTTATYAANMPTITAPTYSGFTFLGYFDEKTGGTKYYNANGTNAKAWDKTANTTLYAQWQTTTPINVNTQALIIDAFKWAPTNNAAITVNMSGNIDVYNTTNPAGIVANNGQNITLDLKGYTLKQTNASHSCIIKLAGNCTVHVKDSSTNKTGTITNKNTTASCSAIWVNNANAKFYLDSGTITGCRTDYWGGGVCVDAGQFYMTGGTISNCTATKAANDRGYGGGVCIKTAGSLFTMSGGTITGCTADQWAGGVYCQPDCTFTMTGGTISNCSAGSSGGGADLDGPFTISGGVIENCTAATVGGGLYIHSSCTNGVMSGGVIQNCQAYTYGGGINAGGTFTMSGGVIWKNHLTGDGTGGSAYMVKGAGLYVAGTTTMTGGYIIENTSVRKIPPNVGIGKNSTFNMQGGIIWSSPTSDSYVGTIQQDGGAYCNKTGGLIDPAIDLTLENPLAPIVHITMKEDITLTDVRSEDGTVVTTADTLDFVGNQNVTWDLNGYTLDLNYWHYILVDAGATFTLKDSGTGGNITNGCQGHYYNGTSTPYSATWKNWGGGIYVRKATLNMESGIIQNCTTRHYGGGVAVWGGTFNMTGGTIQKCSTNTNDGGGGVYIYNTTFTMSNDATIKECTTVGYGGGVVSDGVFNMTGGTITGCTAGTHSGGVFVNNGKTFNMTGGTISNCTAGTTGGGVDTNGTFNMTNGIIENCISNGGDLGAGGGVFVWRTGSFTMTDSIIRNCKAASTAEKMGIGGAVHSYGPFTMKGNSLIYGNESQCATVEAPGVSLNGGTFNLQSGIVYDNWNTADNVRAGLYQSTGTLNQTGGYIDPKTVITLDPNGGVAGTQSITVYYGDTAMPAIETPPTRDSYTFQGFFDMAEGGTQYFDAEGNDMCGVSKEQMWDKLDETMTLYAQWKPSNYTITYDANGGEGAPEAMIAPYDAEVTLSSIVPTRTGYSFKEWNTAKDGSSTAYAAEATVTNLSSVGGETVTLYAQWTPNTYTVTLNNGGGSGDASLTATYDAVLPEVTVPTWENHVFEGYFTEADGKGTQYIGKDGKGVKVWDLTADTTLYAYWKESAKVESMDLTLGGDIEMRYHVAVNDPELQESGTMTVSIGGKKASKTTVPYSEAPKDTTGAILFPFNVSSIQMAEPVTVEFKDKDGNVIATDAKSVEDYYNLVKDSDITSADQKEMVRTLVDYGYYAQQALSKTRGWTIGSDYAASTLHGSLSSTSNDLKAYKPVISGTGTNVKDIQLSLLLDNKTTLCVYVLTKDGTAPTITVDGASVTPEDNDDGWWLVRIPDIDALNLSTMHTVEVNGYSVYLSALSYASVASDSATIDAMRALLDYYQATLKANNKTVLTSATVEQSEYEYTGSKIEPVVTAYAGNTQVTGCDVTWNGELTNAGTYTGLVTKANYVGGVTVTVTITPKKVAVPTPNTNLTYNGSEQTGVGKPSDAKAAPAYSLAGNTATNAGDYTATATLTDTKNTCWSDGTTDDKSIAWSITKKQIEIPTAVTGLVYNGNAQTGVNGGDGYTLTGNTGTNAVSYTAAATLADTTNTCWNDEGKTTDAKTIEWSIAKADPTVQSDVSVTYYPNGDGSNTMFSGSMNVSGNFSYDPSNGTTFTPEDTTNYNTVSVNANVTTDSTAAGPNVSLGN